MRRGDWSWLDEKSRCNNEEFDYAIDFKAGDGLHVHPRNGGKLFMSEKSPLSQPASGPLGEISQAPPAFEVFLDKHQVKLFALAAILAIAALIYVVFEGVAEGREEAAGIALSKAEDVSGYQSVVKNHEGTRAAFSAKVLLAEKQWEDGKKAEAIETLEKFVEADREHPAYASAASSLATKLATKLASEGKLEEASSLLNDLAEDPQTQYLAPFAWISLGDIYAQKGETEKAEKAYSMVESENPGSPFVRDANARLLLVKAQAPKVVAAPIEVPEVNLSGENDSTEGGDESTGPVNMEDLLKAASDGASQVDTGILEAPSGDNVVAVDAETSSEQSEVDETEAGEQAPKVNEEQVEEAASSDEAVEIPEIEISE